MNLVAHQAVYGEVNGAHALVAKSLDAKSPFAELIRHTDRPPGHLPPNLNWEPYISGYPLDEFYIISKTFPDATASRSGMVLTHALIFKANELVLLEDLNEALQLLPAISHKPSVIGNAELVAHQEPTHSTKPGGLGNVIHLLLDEKRGDKPVVWIGQDGFDEIIVALWRGLWIDARRTFRFRLSFTPQDAEGQRLTIVATPAQMENRWSGYPLGRISDLHEPQTQAEAFLMGYSEGEPLRTLLYKLEAAPRTIDDIKKVEACSHYLESLRAGTISVNGARMLVRLLGALTKLPTQGAELKSRALNELLALTTRGNAMDIQALRNLDLAPFKSGAEQVEEAVGVWFKQNALSKDIEAAEQNAGLIALSFDSGSSLWGNAVQNSLRHVLSDWHTGTATAIWRWWQKSPAIISPLDPLIPNSKRVEADLAKQCPRKLPKEVGEDVRLLAEKRGWLVLHATTVAAYCNPVEALHKQMQVDTDKGNLDGFRALVDQVPAEAIIEVALDTADIRLLRLAGEACAATPRLFEALDINRQEWRKVWIYSIEAGGQLWAGITNPREVVDVLIDLLIDGTVIDIDLLANIADTAYADLSHHPRRSEAWRYLDETVRMSYLTVTADGWLQRFRANASFDPMLERDLEEVVLDSARIAKHIAAAGTGSVPFLVNLFRHFTRLNSRQFEDQLNAILSIVQPLNAFDAILVGKLVMDKRWRDCAGRLAWYVDARNRRDLVPALQECQSLLGWFDSFRLKLSGKMSSLHITADDWWNALRETALEIYPYGPDQDQIWERAGGEAWIINRNQSGQAKWEEVLQTLRRGGGGKDISPSKLVGEMRRDFENNPKLQLLQQWGEQR